MLISALLLTLATKPVAPPPPPAAPPQLDLPKWVAGPSKVDLGVEAELSLAKEHLFVDGPQARKLLESGGDRPTGDEVGLVIPNDPAQKWAVIFEYKNIGYVKDDEKDKIDP